MQGALNPLKKRAEASGSKGGGYSDLEFALARAVGAVGERTPVLTTVHELQVVDEPIPMTGHDVPLDVIVTSRPVIHPRQRRRKPRGILWPELSAEERRASPPLCRLRS